MSMTIATYLRSFPITSVPGYISAMSIAQIPVPVPISTMRYGVSRGAKCNFPSSKEDMIVW